MMPDFCLVTNCGKRINVRPSVEDFSVIQCGKCKGIAHTICVNLTKDEVRFYIEEERQWSCPQCAKNETSTRYMSPEPGTSDNLIMSAIREVTMKLDIQKTDILCVISKLEKRLDLFMETVKKVEALSQENLVLKKSVSVLEGKLCNIEQQMRETSIDIVGVPLSTQGNESESIKDIVLNVLNTGFEMNLNEMNIVDCYRLYPKTNKNNVSNAPTPNNTPVISVKLSSTHIKNTIFRNKSKMKKNLNTKTILGTKTESQIFVNESLCPNRRTLFNKARSVMKELKYKYVWIKHGVVLMKKNDESEVRIINSLDDISKLK